MNAYTLFDGVDVLFQKQHHVIWLRSKTYSPLSMQAVRVVLSKHTTIHMLSAEDAHFSSIQSQCATSFLGNSYWYYLADLTKQFKQKNSSWYIYLSSYRGPHTLIFWAESSSVQTPPSSWCIVDIPDMIDAKSATRLTHVLYDKQSHAITSLLAMVWASTPSISLEEFCRLAMYAHVMGSQDQQDMKEHISTLISTDISLFTLSQYLFAKQRDAFYKQWHLSYRRYPTLFWITFWSDQVWRATLFIRSMRANKRSDAYDIAKYKLPFSFSKTDWANLDAELLQKQYGYLCDVDYMLKNGGNEIWLELFFLRWFAE